MEPRLPSEVGREVERCKVELLFMGDTGYLPLVLSVLYVLTPESNLIEDWSW